MLGFVLVTRFCVGAEREERGAKRRMGGGRERMVD